MVSTHDEYDEAIWVPVAKGKSGGSARAFLPYNGLGGSYRFGYKASPSNSHYFDALRQIQEAYINDEKATFRVNGGKKEERQWRARWWHGNETGSPLLGPTLGWVLVPVTELEKVSGFDLGKALNDAGKDRAEVASAEAPPVLCESPEDLERESARLFREGSSRKPAGQATPARLQRSTEQFVRDARVVAYVLRQADGTCECCLKPAPFRKHNGLPYLEVHHVKPLAAGGSDKVSNAVVVCPNCHRELRHGANSVAVAEALYSLPGRLLRE